MSKLQQQCHLTCTTMFLCGDVTLKLGQSHSSIHQLPYLETYDSDNDFKSFLTIRASFRYPLNTQGIEICSPKQDVSDLMPKTNVSLKNEKNPVMFCPETSAKNIIRRLKPSAKKRTVQEVSCSFIAVYERKF